MNVIFKVENIIEAQVQGLVCSGNIHLNMSGGVNGALLQSGGADMQKELHKYLLDNNLNFVEPGFVIRIGPKPFHFKSIVYTVAINGFYESSIELVEKSLKSALALLADDGCQTIAIPALATGYGNLSKKGFGKALSNCLKKTNWSFEELFVVARDLKDLSEIEVGFSAIS